jgi:hypothetical protein
MPMLNAGAKQVQSFLAIWGMKTPKAKHKHPDLCDLCGAPIKIEDKYYAGFTHSTSKKKVWAFTCLNYNCTRWLIAKKLFEKDK